MNADRRPAAATLFCVTDRSELADACRAWSGGGSGGLAVRSTTPARLAEAAPAELAGREPYALLADGTGLDAALVHVAGLTGPYPCLALVVAGVAPRPDLSDHPEHPVAMIGIAGDCDVGAPVDAVARWALRFGRQFRMRVVEGGTDFLITRGADVLEMVEMELGARPVGTPPLADWPQACRSLAAHRSSAARS